MAKHLVGRLEGVLLALQAVWIILSSSLDRVTPPGQMVMLAVAALHFGAALCAFRWGGPFVRGPVWMVWMALWLGSVLLVPVLMASLVQAGEYGASPGCVQMCPYPIPVMAMLAFYPWHGAAIFVRPALDVILLAVVVLEPLAIMLAVNGSLTPDNASSWIMSGIISCLAYAVGRTVGVLCGKAVEAAGKARKDEEYRTVKFLHSHIGQALAAIGMHYRNGRADLVLSGLQKLDEDLLAERQLTALAHDQVSVSQVLGIHAARVRGAIRTLQMPAMSGLTVRQPVAELFSDALGDLLKNAIQHGGADVVVVDVGVERGVLCLNVTDNGPGLDPDRVDWSDGNLGRLRRDVRVIHGDLRVSPKPAGAGTHVRVCLPLHD